MNAEAQRETLEFQAEVRQILDLMIHSLYSNREIFLRELISNASDAADRLRFEALQNEALWEQDPDPAIRLRVDSEAGTLTVSDNGSGVDETLRERIFEPFFTTRRQGTGLGLAVVRSVAVAHGGSVCVENHAEGATFLLRLPGGAEAPLLASRTAIARAGGAAAAARSRNEFRSYP